MRSGSRDGPGPQRDQPPSPGQGKGMPPQSPGSMRQGQQPPWPFNDPRAMYGHPGMPMHFMPGMPMHPGMQRRPRADSGGEPHDGERQTPDGQGLFERDPRDMRQWEGRMPPYPAGPMPGSL